MCVLVYLNHPVKIGLGVVPPIAGQAAFVVVGNMAGRLLPDVPLVVGVAALHLMRCGGCAPLEIFWKIKCCAGHV